jgi:hypothetical protein
MLRHLVSHCITAVFASVALSAAVWAADLDGLELFEKQIRPALLDQCIRCHGEEKRQGGLRLDSRQGWMTGGDSGPAIVPGKPEQSLLVEAVRYESTELEMPPKGVLPDTTIQAIEQWIRLGAPDPRHSDSPGRSANESPSVDQGREFWSFQPIDRPELPSVAEASWPRNPIDRFVLSRLEQNGLQPAGDGDRTTLVRRAYFDLIGLPPTPEQIDDFVKDSSPHSYARLVDRLLDSPQFGQRWGRHWLDVVRFAQSSGGGRTLLFPNAWRYRDYVIDSFNDDVPYDQFLMEQLAGDLLESADWQDRRRMLVATAFLLIGPTNYEMQDKDILEMDVVDEQLDTIGKGMLGMTLGCARCHDHKFDPIPARDYYAMAGILKSTKAMIHSNVSQWNTAELPLSPAQEAAAMDHDVKLTAAKAELKQATQAWIDAGGEPNKKRGQSPTRSIDPTSIRGIVIDDDQAERIGDWTESTSTAGYVGPRYLHDAEDDKGNKSVIYRPQLASAGRYEIQIAYPESSNRSTRVPVHVHHADGETIVTVNQRQPPSINGHRTSLGKFDLDLDRDSRVVISTEGTSDGVVIADAIVFLAAGEPVVPTTAPNLEAPEQESPEQENEAELALLEAAVDRLTNKVKSLEASAPIHPVAMATTDDEDTGDIHLAIRGVVHNPGPIVRRGVLQVASTGQFPKIRAGQSGRRELALWIADRQNPLTARVMANRVWHWLIGSGIVPTVDNFGSMGERPSHDALLDHLASSFVDDGWSVKSLIRRIMLSRTYQMDSRGHDTGADVDPDNRLLWRMNRKRLRAEDIRDSLLLISGDLDHTCGGPNLTAGTKSEYGYQFQSKRRSVYVPVFRNTLPEIFEVFDFADPNIQRGRRTSSTIVSQALLLMNHPWVIERSRSAANNLLRNVGPDCLSRVEYAFGQVLGRKPTPDEMTVAVDFIVLDSEDKDDPERWALLYQTLFQSIDFRYLN